MTDKAPKLKIPKTPGKCADLLYTLKQKAKELAKPLEVVEAQVKQLEAHIIETFPADDVAGVIGEHAKVVVNRMEVATVREWKDLYAYIVGAGLIKLFVANGCKPPTTDAEVAVFAFELVDSCAFDLLQRRVSSPAVLARKADGIAVPGTESLFVKKVSCVKR